MSNGHYRRSPRAASVLAGFAVACLFGGALLVPAPVSADPPVPDHAPATPTIAQVKTQLDTLNRRAEIASEAYNTVHVRLHEARAQMASLSADVTRQQSRVDGLRGAIVEAALSDYESTGGLSTSTTFFVSKSPGQFLSSLASSAIVEHQQAGLLTQLRQQRNVLAEQQRQAGNAVAAIAADKQRLAQHKAALNKNVKAAKSLLAQLQKKQRMRVLALQQHQTSNPNNYDPTSRGGARPPVRHAPVSGRAAVAVSTALAQIGKPYVYGAAGPNSFDCSGLTMYSWRAAGVSLSHSSSIQSYQGVPVSLSALQPGDLVFYYSPVSHVAMYIGNGMVVHAPHPGSVVQIVPLYSMPVSWARRVG